MTTFAETLKARFAELVKQANNYKFVINKREVLGYIYPTEYGFDLEWNIDEFPYRSSICDEDFDGCHIEKDKFIFSTLLTATPELGDNFEISFLNPIDIYTNSFSFN